MFSRYQKETARIAEAEERRGNISSDLRAAAEAREREELASMQRALDAQEEKLRRLEEEKHRKVEESVKEIKAHHAAERLRLHEQRVREKESLQAVWLLSENCIHEK